MKEGRGGGGGGGGGGKWGGVYRERRTDRDEGGRG